MQRPIRSNIKREIESYIDSMDEQALNELRTAALWVARRQSERLDPEKSEQPRKVA